MSVALAGFIYSILTIVVALNLYYLRRKNLQPPLQHRPAVSVLIPARNERDNLTRLIPQILDQSYPTIEIIVYDDESDDGSWEYLQSIASSKLHVIKGKTLPAGWIGKVHALYRATRAARGELYLFLDADCRLEHTTSVEEITLSFEQLPEKSVLTGYPRLVGGGRVVSSLLPFSILALIPWPLVRTIRTPSLSALNGQVWMIRSSDYHRYEPHAQLPGEILEDVKIGRYLKTCGLTPVFIDLQRLVSVLLYADLKRTWNGLRKNAYLLMGGHPVLFIPIWLGYVFVFLYIPLLHPGFLAVLYGLKAVTDRLAGIPIGITLLAPLSFLLGAFLSLDSARTYWSGKREWKGRRV